MKGHDITVSVFSNNIHDVLKSNTIIYGACAYSIIRHEKLKMTAFAYKF